MSTGATSATSSGQYSGHGILYRKDQVLQQSAAGTLRRLQFTLSSSENLRSQVYAAVASQQQLSLEQAHNEAVLLHEEQERQLQRQNQEAIRVRQAGND